MLFQATKYHVYWKSITILVPVTWSRSSQYEQAHLESYENANVLVDFSVHNDLYVMNPYLCFAMGEYIQLSRIFVLDKDYRESTFGRTGRIFTIVLYMYKRMNIELPQSTLAKY